MILANFLDKKLVNEIFPRTKKHTLLQRILFGRNRANFLHERITVTVWRKYILHVLFVMKRREIRIKGKIVPIKSQSVLRREVG